jgi:hypothetical protein
MKRLISVAALLMLTFGPAQAQPQTHACAFKMKAGCVSGTARVTLADGIVTGVAVDMIWCGPRGRPGYTCTIDSTRDDKESDWSDENGATIVANPSRFNPTEPDRVKVTVGKHVSIDLAETQSLGRCGAGAALPRAIVIPAAGGACRVWLDAR